MPTPANVRPAPAAPAPAPAAAWGRVDDAGVVWVREGESWREVGEYPDGTPDEALAYFRRKFDDLQGELTLLQARHRSGGVAAAELRTVAEGLRERVVGAAAVGDLAGLVARLDALLAQLETAQAAQHDEARQATEAAVAERTALVERMEALAAADPAGVQWKQTSAQVEELFTQWQAAQQSGPHLPKSAAARLWKRFRAARTTVDRARRDFYAQLDQAHRVVRDRKTTLVERAEALASRGEDGIPAYRDLLDEWKRSGRAGKKADDALWARFKAAGDVLYGARGAREEAEVESSREKIQAKEALLERARPILDEKDLAAARTALTDVQREWEQIGRIFPRETERALDGRLRAIEQSVKVREDADWKRNEPETRARADAMTEQLTEAIEKLEREHAAAVSAGDQRAAAAAAEALQARRAWLRAVGH